MSYDVEAARAAGHSDEDIANHLAQTHGYDVLGARKEGYSDADIVKHLAPLEVKAEEKQPSNIALPAELGLLGGAGATAYEVGDIGLKGTRNVVKKVENLLEGMKKPETISAPHPSEVVGPKTPVDKYGKAMHGGVYSHAQDMGQMYKAGEEAQAFKAANPAWEVRQGSSFALPPDLKAAAAARAPQVAPGFLAKAQQMAEPVMSGIKSLGTPLKFAGKVLAPIAGAFEAGTQGGEAWNRGETGDTTGAVISGIGALGSGAMMSGNPFIAIPGAAVSMAAPQINKYRDLVKQGRIKHEAPNYQNFDTMGNAYAHGGLVHLAEGGESNTAPFIGYPHITNKPRDPNFVQQSGPILGGLDAILGLGARDDVSMLTPEGQAYHKTYEKYEPAGIAANTVPFMGGPTKAVGKAALRELGPKAAGMAENYLTKIGGIAHAVPPDAFAPVKKSGVQLAREANYAHDLVPTHNFSEPQKLSIQDLQGGVLVGVPGDRSLTGHSLMSVNGVPLSKSVELHGGPRYGQRKSDLGEDAFWASQSGAASALQNKATNAAERAKGNPVFGMYTAMAPDASNYALHHTEALVNQLDALSPNKAKLRAFDSMIKEQHPDFLGMQHPEVMDQFAANSDLRKYVADRLNKSKIAAEYGMPSGEATIHAITDPALRNVSTGSTGFSVGEMRPGASLRPELEHPTYDTQIPGQFKGQMIAQLPWQHYFPEAAAKIAANPNQAPHAWGTFKMGDYHQRVTQELVDKISPIEEMLKSASKDFKGYAPGGKVLSALGKSLGEAQAAYKAKFTPDFVHFSPSPSIKAFDPSKSKKDLDFTTQGVTFVAPMSNAKWANDNFLPVAGDVGQKEMYKPGATGYPVSVNLGKHFDASTPEGQQLINDFANKFQNTKMTPDARASLNSVAPGYAEHVLQESIAQHKKDLGTGNYSHLELPEFLQHLRDTGHNTFKVNESTNFGRGNVGVFNPADIRGKFAKFNPEDAASPDFMRASGGLIRLK